jgi:hypothetical protein
MVKDNTAPASSCRTRKRLVRFFVCLVALSLVVFGIIGGLALLPTPSSDHPPLPLEKSRVPEARLLDRNSLQQEQP